MSLVSTLGNIFKSWFLFSIFALGAEIAGRCLLIYFKLLWSILLVAKHPFVTVCQSICGPCVMIADCLQVGWNSLMICGPGKWEMLWDRLCVGLRCGSWNTQVCRNAVCPWTWGQFPTKPTAPTWSKHVISRKTLHYYDEHRSEGAKNLSYLGHTENTKLWYLLSLCSAVCFPLHLFVFLWNFLLFLFSV